MWYTVVTILHIFSCFFLITVVLLQTGKGADVSAVFGGSSQTLFGSSGAGNFLTKLTTATAVVFMLTSLTLTYGAAKQTSKSLFDNPPVSAPAPAAPEKAPSAQTGTSEESQGVATVAAEQKAPSAQTGTSGESQGVATVPAEQPAQTTPPAATAPAPTGQPSPPSTGETTSK